MWVEGTTQGPLPARGPREPRPFFLDIQSPWLASPPRTPNASFLVLILLSSFSHSRVACRVPSPLRGASPGSPGKPALSSLRPTHSRCRREVLRRAAELISNLNTTVRSAFEDDETSPLILIVRTQGNWSYESLINSMISKSPQNLPWEKTNSRKNWKENSLLRKQKREGRGTRFNILQKKIANETKSQAACSDGVRRTYTEGPHSGLITEP